MPLPKLLPRIFLALFAAALCFAQAPTPGRAAYRLEIKIRDTEDQRASATRTFTLMLVDRMRGGTRAGKKVQLADRNWIDIGLNIDATLSERPDNSIRADIEVDVTALEGTVVQQIRSHAIADLTPGKAAVVSSLHDPVLQRRLDVEATVSRLP